MLQKKMLLMYVVFCVCVCVCVSHQTNKCVFSLGRDCFQKNSVHIVFDNYNVAFATCS